VERVIIVVSAREPKFRPRLIDRYLVAAEYGELEAVICINKIDLDLEGSYEPSLEMYRSLGYPAIATSVTEGVGLDELRELLKDKMSVLAGQSGVGKSSLLSKIDPELDLKSIRISSKTGKGQHTTKAASLLTLSFGGYVIDTPGIRQFSLWDVPAVDLAGSYPEIARLGQDCRFQPCSHVKEIDCAVKAALEAGDIFPTRYESYVSLYEDLRKSEKK
jgi:ribosome biogenesis GTPase